MPQSGAATPGSASAKSLLPSAKSGVGHIRHGQFSIMGQQGRGVKKYVLVPDGEAVSKSVWDQIFKAWKLKSPNLLIWVKSGTMHPMKIVTGHLSKSEQFQALLQSVNEAHPEHAKTAAAGSDETPNPGALEVVNKILRNKLKAVMDGIANAADQTNSWILIVGTPGQGEVLLEDALGRSNATPIILVVDHLTHSLCSESEYSRAMTEELDHAAVPLATSAKEVVELRGDLWDPAVHTKPASGASAEGHRHFLEMAQKTGAPFGCWEFHSTADPRAKGYPWMAWPFRSGTHYILFQNATDMDARDLAHAARLTSLGPLGYVFLGGGTDTLAEVKNAVVNAMPSVLLKNTGRVTQQWALLFGALKASQQETPPKQPEATALLRAVRTGYDEAGLKESIRMTLPDVIEVLDVFKSRPEVFVDTLSVVDPLEDTPERVLNALSRCFASSATGIVELGVGAAQDEVVLEAWRLHAELDHNARKKKFTSDVLMFISLVLTFLTTAIAVVITAVGMQEDWRAAIPDPYWKMMEVLCLVFPALSGLITTVISRLRLVAKWSTLQVAASRIVAEIYHFRTSTGQYNPTCSGQAAADKEKDAHRDEEEGSKDEDNAGMLRREVRMRFIHKVQQIAEQVGNSDMKGDSLSRPEGDLRSFQRSSRELFRHVEKNVVQHSLPNPRAKDAIGGAADTDYSQYMLLSVDTGTDTDDFVSPISTEAYIEYRMRPLLDRFRGTTPGLSTQLIFTEVVIFVLATVGTLLAALGLREWIPVSVAGGSVLNALVEYRGLQPRLEAANASVTEVQNLLTMWAGLSMVDRRMPAIREHMVRNLEKTVLAEVAARAPASAVLSAASEAESEATATPAQGEGSSAPKKER